MPLGIYLYGPSISSKVQRLPFGMSLKVSDVEWHRGLENELAALDLLQQRTSIPVPKALGLFVHDGESFLLSTRVPGMPLGHLLDKLSDAQLAAVIGDLQICVEQLRAVTRPAGSDERSVSGTNGEPCYDFRVISGMSMNDPARDGDFTGPFDTELDFSRTVQWSAEDADRERRSQHRIVFTHGDFNLRNVLVTSDGRFSGLVDWENAGWYPEHWEYTKAHFVTKYSWRWLRAVDVLFARLGDYSEELEVEKELWASCY